jgi:hypothetical protein
VLDYPLWLPMRVLLRWTTPPPPPGGQVSKEELQTAMGFLREQLGEDELRLLLEELNTFSEDGVNIDVSKLMALAEKDAEAQTVKATGLAAVKKTLEQGA